MPEPIPPAELPQPQRLTIGETPVYLKAPVEINGQQVTALTINSASARGKDGPESSMLLIADKARRTGPDGTILTKPLTNVNAMEEVEWDAVGGVRITLADGTTRDIPKEALSLVKPEVATQATQATPARPANPPIESARTSPEPSRARRLLEQYSGTPTTLTIVGLKAYETRAHDFAERAMQLKTSLADRIWKHGIGPVYYHEQLRRHYLAMLKASQSPFAEGSIQIAEAAAANRYRELLDNKNFMTRASRRLIEWMKDSLGIETLVQKFAVEEIAAMSQKGEIKERDAFDREAGAIRTRFEQDVDREDVFIRQSLGEKLTILDPANAETQPMVDAIKSLVKEYATGTIATKKDFDAKTDELFQTHLKSSRPDIFDQAELYTASLYDVADHLRTKAGHEGGLAAIDAQLESMQVRLGMGVMGEATALVPSDVERGTKAVMKAVDWMEKKGIIGPKLFNEATVGTAVALSLSLSILPRMGVSRLASGLGGLGAGSVVAGIFGGLREYRQLEREYLTHIREREAGLTFPPDAKRRAWMERFMVGQRSAEDLIAAIASPDPAVAIAHLADAKARLALSARSDGMRVGLIQFTGKEHIETQRTALALAVAQAEKNITAAANPDLPNLTDLTAAQTRILSEGIARVEGLSDPIRQTLGVLDPFNPQVEIMRRRFPLLGREAKTGAKAQGLEEIFKEFRSAARGAAVRKGLEVGLTSAAVGWVSREVLQAGVNAGWEAAHPTGEVKTVFAFSGQQHFLDNPAGGGAILAPKELHWDVTPTGRQLILDARDAGGNTIKKILYTQSGTPDGNGPSLFELTRNHPQLAFTPEESATTIKQLHDVTVNTLPPVYNTYGEKLVVNAAIPDGTSLVEVTPFDAAQKFAVYDLVNDQGERVLTNIEIDQYGGINNIDLLNDNRQGLHVTLDRAGIVDMGQETGGAGATFTKKVAQMGATPGKRGVWNWMLETIQGEKRPDQSVKHLMPATNLTKNLFRGYEEVMVHKANVFLGGTAVNNPGLAYGAMGDAYEFRDLPKALFYDEAINGKIPLVELGRIMDRAIELKEIQKIDFGNINPAEMAKHALTREDVDLYKAAYEIGRVGRVATREEIELFLKAMKHITPESAPITIFRPVIDQITTETIPATITGIPGEVAAEALSQAPELAYWPSSILWRSPLEAYKPLAPYEPPPVVPGDKTFPLLPRPEEERPAPFLVVPYGPDTREDNKEYANPYGPKYANDKILAYYRERRHPDLLANPDARLGFETAAHWYLDRLPADYRKALEALNQTIGVPMHDEARIAVCIPVAAHEEGNNIYHTLQQYAGQSMDKNQYEILLFLNVPDKGDGAKTLSEVRRFMADHPDMAVRTATGSFPAGTVRFGAYIKYAYDLAILRALTRQHPKEADLLIATADADLEAIDPAYLQTATDLMHAPQGRRLDGLLTLLDFDKDALSALPTMKAAARFGQYVEHKMHEAEEPYVQTSGAVSILRAGTLAAVGGVNPSTPAGADIEIGRMIHYARHGKMQGIPKQQYTVGYTNSVGIRTNARRQIATHISGRPLTATWDQFDEGEDVRGKSTPELIAKAPPEKKTLNAADLEREINSYRGWGVAMDSAVTARALSWMGLTEGTDYVIVDDPDQAHRGNQWQKKIRFTGDLSALSSRIQDLPASPAPTTPPSEPTSVPPAPAPEHAAPASTGNSG